MKLNLSIRERVEAFIEHYYYKFYACPRGKHRMKMSGCVHCGKRS